MEDVVILEWNYSPADFFETALEVHYLGCSVSIDGGKVVAKIAPGTYGEGHQRRNEFHTLVESRFVAVQLTTHRSFKLSGSAFSRRYPDGRRDVAIIPDSLAITPALGYPDRVVLDAAGKVVSDTRRERLDQQSELTELIFKHRGAPLVGQLTASYRAAIDDPDNEFVHLYEIRDALKKEFRGQAKACPALGISDSDWEDLGTLANTKPLSQGRHRGQHYDAEREAQPPELEAARRIAKDMIAKYLSFLDRSAPLP
jgi:hypothetical protein